MTVETHEADGQPEGEDAPGNAPVPRSRVARKKFNEKGTFKGKPGTSPRAKKNLAKQQTKILAQEKTRKALELRKAGASYHQIAQAVGYGDASAARKAVQRGIEKITQEPALELRSLQIERLNHMLMVLWPKVQQGDTSAVNTSLNVMNKLDALVGTEAATTVDVNVNHSGAVMVIDGNEEDFVSGMKRMAGLVDQQSGQNHGAPALPSVAPQVIYPPGMGPAHTPAHDIEDADEDVVDAEIVDEPAHAVAEVMECEHGVPYRYACEDCTREMEEEQDEVDQERTGVDIPVESKPGKKFSFGVDPTVKR